MWVNGQSCVQNGACELKPAVFFLGLAVLYPDAFDGRLEDLLALLGRGVLDEFSDFSGEF